MGNGNEIIIMVDDDVTNLTVGASSLEDKYNIFTATSGRKLFQILEKVTPDLILLDIDMPDMDGYEVIKILKSSKQNAHIPVIFLTAKIDPESEVMGLSLGAVDYITKPFSRELLVKRIDLHILFEKQKKELLNYSRGLEGEVSRKTRIVFELQNAILKTVAELVECRDSVTGGHIERTQYYLSLLFEFLMRHDVYLRELTEWNFDLFIMSSQLHDVGKIAIKDDILLKPDRLTDDEFEIMKNHVVFGVDIIRRIESNTSENDFLKYAEIFAGSHHERWNGTGYPLGLKGAEIPLQGRMMAIVDVYDALTNDRPYKRAFTHEEAMNIIKDGRGTHFDPLVCDIFVAHNEEFANHSIKKSINLNKYAKKTYEETKPAGAKGGNIEKTRRYLKIFIEALLKNEKYKKEVSSWDIDLVLMSVRLYDAGKTSVSDDLLDKTEKLTGEEFDKVKAHADFGLKVIQQIKENINNANSPGSTETLTGSHHEKWDGTGCPHGFKGEAIPLQGRVMAIIEVYEALTHNRPHRNGKTHEEAAGIIKSCKGTHFDPRLVDIFIEIGKSFEKEFGKEGFA